MTYEKRILLLLAILICEAVWAGEAYAASPLPPPPAAGWCGNGPNATGYFDVAACTTPPPTGCVADPDRSRMSSTTVGYSVRNTNPRLTDALQFSSIFGRGATTDTPKAFPGVDGTGPVIAWPLAHRYYAGVFVATVGRISGTLAFESNLSRGCRNTNGSPGVCGQPYYNVTISATCGDFNPATAIAIGRMPDGSADIASDGQPHFRYTEGYLPGDLQPGRTYYLNIRLSDAADHWGTSFMTWRGRVTP